MDLAELSVSNGGFYVPTWQILVDGKDLLRDLLVAVSQVEADLVLSAAGRFSFTVVDAYNILKSNFISGKGQDILKLLSFGAVVEIRMGYGDASKLSPIMTGVITEIGTSFPESGYPELSVAGYDHSFPMTVGKNSKTWSKASDSDVVAEIARFHNLQGDIETTLEKHAQIEQNQESDMEFIKKLAERNHFEFYVRDKTLRFGKPKDQGDGVVALKWGKGLLSFKPTANLAGQVTAVEVYGWDLKSGKAIVGRAQAGTESGRPARSESGGDALKKPGNQQPVLRIRQPVFTQAEADTRAKAALNEIAKQFLTGDAESVGLPEIRPDEKVTLAEVGETFSKTYYVQQATHKVDGNGYRTRFKVKETSVKKS